MTKILFIKNEGQLKHITQLRKELLNFHEIIAITPLLWHKLQAEGYKSKLASEFFSDSDLTEVMNQASSLSKSWYSSFKRFLRFKDIDLGEIIGCGMGIFFREMLAASKIINRIIEVYKPAQITLFADLSTPCSDVSQKCLEHDVFEAVAIFLCEQRNIRVQKLFLNAKYQVILKKYSQRIKLKTKEIIKSIPILENYCLSAVRFALQLFNLRNAGHYDNRRLPLKSFIKRKAKNF